MQITIQGVFPWRNPFSHEHLDNLEAFFAKCLSSLFIKKSITLLKQLMKMQNFHQETYNEYQRQRTEPRYNLRPRNNQHDGEIQLHNPQPSALVNSPTAVLRSFGLVCYSSDELGVGHYSKVYKASQNNRELAVKVVRLDIVGEEFRKRFLPREREVWEKLRHRNICELYTCFDYADRYLFMLMEYCSNGDLLSHIQSNGALGYTLGRRWLQSILSAIRYLHRQNIAHRDIKAENVLISHTNNVKLTDFGFACEQPPNFYSRTFCGSRAYSSPEILSGIPYDVKKNDVWSFGVLCYVAMTNTMPFREDTLANAAIIEQQRRGVHHWPSSVPYDIRQSVNAMLAFHQSHRPSAAEIKYFSFFSKEQRAYNHFGIDSPYGIYA